MKKLAILVAALVLALGLAQCKKEQPATPQNTEGNLVHLTVNVGNGSRADVDTITGVVSFSNGDKLYVGYNGACVGTLDYSATTNKFSGDLNLTQSGDQRLHFYYLGGEVKRVDETQQYTVDIYEQYENPYPVISYGTSTEDYSTDEASYSTTLENQCALVEFTTNWIRKDSRIYIEEINNQVIIDFANNTFTPGRYGNEQISLYPETPTSRWAILLPSEEQMTVTVAPVDYDNIEIIIPPVHKNDFLHFSFELTAMDADEPLTMKAAPNTNGVICVINPPEGMKYSKNNGEKENITGDIEISVQGTLEQLDMVQFYGNSKDYSNTKIVSTDNVELSGNIMSLVDEYNFATATTMEGASFAGLFAGNTHGINASGLLLPATTLSQDCYSGMFAGCSRMDGGPAELPALTLVPGCYSNMFKGCDQIMWAATLVLPATELVDRCYFNMFDGCGNLEALICLATTINGTDCTTEWLNGVKPNGTFTKAKGASFWDDPDLGYYDGIPWGWEVNEY